jgi:hypothetical protein
MVYGFDQHLENLGLTGWVVMILLCAVAYLYYENKDLRQSKNATIDRLVATHEAEIKRLTANKKEPIKTQKTTQSKNELKGSYIDCDFDDTIPF